MTHPTPPPRRAALRVLLVEDNPVDAELIVRSLRDAGFDPAVRRVETEAGYLAALAEAPDLILSDFGLPSFNGFEALELLRNRCLDTPFILISGTLGEDLVVKAIKRGADDYLMKDHLVRLGPAVEQVLRAKSLRDEARRAALERQRMVDTHAAVLDALPAHIALLDERGVIVTVNETWRRFAAENGSQPDRDGVGCNYLEVCERAVGGSAEGALAVADGIRAVLRGELAEFSHEYPCHSPVEPRWFRLIVSPQSQNRPGGAVVTHVNITARKRAEDTLQASHREYEQHHAALLQLARSPALQGNAEAAALAEITSTLAQAMKVARVSFWSFTPDRSAIVCHDLFHAPTAGHAAGQVLRAADFPGYFQALAANDILAADDARSDPRTREFAATYLEPEGIASMLDAPVLVGGVLEGVLCVEHVGTVRRWTVSECNLAMAVSSLVAQLLARSAQARSEAQLRAILDNEPECVMAVGLDGRLLDMNPAGLRMIEADDRATVVGRPFVDLVHPDDRARFQALHRRVVAGENGRLQFRIRGLLGTERWMDTHATPLSSAQGAIDAVLSVTRDITEQRRVEAALKDSEERHRLLFLNNPIPSWVYDLETLRFLGVNDAAVAKYGYTREEFLGMTVKDIRPAEDVPALLKDIASVPRGVVSSGIWRHRLKSGQIIQVEIKGHVLEFDGRRTELILATDVTDRLRAEEEKRQALERERIARQEAETARRYYQLLFEYAPGCYVVLQPDDYQIVAVSEAYLKATMTRRDEIQGRRLFEVFPDMPADPEADGTRKVRESLERVKALGRSDVMAVQRYPIRRPQPDGGLWEERYWSCVNTPVPGPEGRIAFIIHRVEDVTEYIRAGPSAGNAPDAQSVLDTRASQMEADIMLRSFELKRANEELARSQALLRIAGRTARLGGWAWELEPEILTWSDETCGIHDRPAGYQPTLAEGLSYYADEHRARIETLVRHSAATGEPFEFEAELVTAKGRRIWVRSSGEALKDEAGRVRAMQGAIQDITVHKRQEAERETLRRRNAALVTALGEIVYEWRPAEDRLVWDGNFTAVLGYSRKEMGNRTAAWTARVHPDDLAAVMKAVEVAVDEHRNYSFEYRLRRKDGTYLWMRDSGVVFVDAQGRLERIIGVLTDVSVRREGEERTRTLALRLQRTLESITDAFFAVDRAWRFSYLNPAAERLLGRSADSLLGREIWHEFPASVGTEFERNYRRAARDNVAAHFQEYYPAPLNAWYDVRAYPSDEGLAVYFQDVSTQRRQQQALRESEERFRLLANATNDAIWDWDLATDALWWNEGFETLFGFSRAEVEPTIVSWTSRVHPADHDAVVADVQRAIEAGDVFWSSEYRFRRKDGSYAFVLDRGHILRDAAGKGMRMIGGMTDLTERRKTEERLREQASLLDAAQDAIFVSDPEHRLIYCNHSAERLYGWRADEMIGRSARELLHTDAAQFDAAVQQLLADGKWSGPLVQRKRDGGTIEVEGRWTLMRDAANQPKSVLVVNTDITERKKLEQQFLRAQRLESIGTLAGGIAHDLNNLLAPITMGVQLLRHFEPQAESRPIIDNIERAAGRGASLVKQVLSFARGVEGARVAVQVRHIVREVESILANTFPKSIRVTSSLPSGLWLVTGDPTQLNQTLLNLCVNARDAMPHGGTLTLAAENIEIDAQYAAMNRDAAPGRYVVLSVTDTGTGIPREILDRMFDPFFTTKDVGQGTGLGLSTVLGIVRSHGGFVNVHSEVGKGSTFRVHLPVQQGGDEADEADVVGGETLPRGKGELVLVVDDEAPIREVTKQTLEAFGYRVIISEDGAQAVGQFALARDEIAVVLTDMMMPVMDGPALISALRHIDPRVRILAASGLNAGENAARASNLGVKHFLAKPYSASTLLDALHRVLTEKGDRRSR